MSLAACEYRCVACARLMAADRFPDDGLCPGCYDNDPAEHANDCRCVRHDEPSHFAAVARNRYGEQLSISSVAPMMAIEVER